MFSISRDTSNIGRKLYVIGVLRKKKKVHFLGGKQASAARRNTSEARTKAANTHKIKPRCWTMTMHLKVNNDLELDINNALTSKRYRKSLLFNTIRKKV